jgi:predicted MPP superfamily phosphohydrolase
MAFISRAVEFAPVFYVTGNHESGTLKKYMELAIRMNEAGVTQLNNKTVSLISEGDVITLAGIVEPDFDWSISSAEKADKEIKEALAGCDREKVTILLSHRPELLKTYAANGVDLVLTGHAHGGQVRLPFIGPVYSPSQGLFPKLTSGLYREGETQMFVSRGIGNGIAPYRFNDGPELAVLVLEPA